MRNYNIATTIHHVDISEASDKLVISTWGGEGILMIKIQCIHWLLFQTAGSRTMEGMLEFVNLWK